MSLLGLIIGNLFIWPKKRQYWLKEKLFEAKFDEYSRRKNFRNVDGGECILKNKVERFVNFNVDVQVIIKLNTNGQQIFSDEGLHYGEVIQKFRDFEVKDLINDKF